MAERKSAIDAVRKICAWVMAVALLSVGVAAVCAAAYIGLRYHDAPPILLEAPAAAAAQVEAMLEEVCDARYGDAAKRMLGEPDLGAEQQPQDELGRLLWDAFAGSMEYALEGECYATEAGLAQDITFTYLDITAATSKLRERSQTLLAQRVDQAEDVSQIYDENNDYREDFVMEVLQAAAGDALREDAETVTVKLTVNLKYQDGQWWIIADKALLDAISGGILF